MVVRYLLPTGQATDALGELVSADAETVVVDGKRGIERIAVADIIAAKEVPPAPEPRRETAVARTPKPIAMTNDNTARTIETGTIRFRSGLLREIAYITMPSTK